MSSEPTPFGVLLREWREAAGVSRAALDEALAAAGVEQRANFTSMTENLRLAPPDEPACNLIANVLGVKPPWAVWEAAALERIRKAGVYDFFLERVHGVTRDPDDDDGQRARVDFAIERFRRRLAHLFYRESSIAPLMPLAGVLEAVLEIRDGQDSATDLFELLFLFARLPPAIQHQKIRELRDMLAGAEVVRNVRLRGGDVLREIDLTYFDRPLPLDDDPGAA